MTTERLAIAAVLALVAAWRLIRWRWHVKRDVKWLEKRFGPAECNESVAKEHNGVWVVGCAAAAVVVLYA